MSLKSHLDLPYRKKKSRKTDYKYHSSRVLSRSLF
uniref:Uncharacterized protein n=1 Tax=Anguilla anguilla TaxID=7936 RepID=A0A0E9VRB3_ANGAN